MLKNILGTIATRIISAVLTFLVVIFNARYLGAENYGTISLIILAVTIIQLFTNFVGGATLIYMAPRVAVFKLFIPAYLWSFVISSLSALVLWFLGNGIKAMEVIPEGYLFQVLILAYLFSFTSVNYMLLLGQEKVQTFNLLNLIQVITQFLFLIFFLFFLNQRDVMAFVWAVVISYVLVFSFSLLKLFPSLTVVPLTGMKQLLRDIFRYGTFVQFANIFQQLNYRLSYYIIDFFIGRAALGVFTVGVQLSEGLWLIGRSIAMVQLTRISNEKDDRYSIRLTLTLAKATWIITLLCMIVLIMIPDIAFQWVFGKEFNEIRPVIIALGIGIITLSASMIFSTFFSGMNKPYHNTISSAIGLVFTFSLGLLLIPSFGIIGAGITATVSYTAATLYLFIMFCRQTKLQARDFLLKREDIRLVVKELKKIIPL